MTKLIKIHSFEKIEDYYLCVIDLDPENGWPIEYEINYVARQGDPAPTNKQILAVIANSQN